MGLSIAIVGGITIMTILIMLGILPSMLEQIQTETTASSEISGVNDSILKTGMQIQFVNTSSGIDIINFDLVSEGNEKLWNYDEFDLLVTYDADISGTKTRVTEQFTFNNTAAFSESEGQVGSASSNSITQIVQISGLTGTADTVDFTISPALNAVDKSFAVCNFRHALAQDHDGTYKSWEILDTSTLRMHNGGTAVSIDFICYVIEFDSSSTVVTQQASMVDTTSDSTIEEKTSTTTPATSTLSPAVTLAETMHLLYGSEITGVDTTIGQEELMRTRLLTTTTWGHQVENTHNSPTETTRIGVIDWNDAAISVQRGQSTMTGTSLTLTSGVDFTAVTPTRSMIFMTFIKDAADFSYPIDNTYMTMTFSGNDIVFEKFVDTGTSPGDNLINWVIVEFPDALIDVEHLTHTMGAGTGANSDTISALSDVNNSFVMSTVGIPFGYGNCRPDAADTTVGAIDRIQVTMDLTSTTNVNFDRNDSTGAIICSYMAVEFLVGGQQREACVGGNPSNNLGVNEWTVNCIMRDYLDSGIINTAEAAEISLKLQHLIFSNGFIKISLSSDNGKTESVSLVL